MRVAPVSAILQAAIAEHQPVTVVGLFSGGNDSTVMIDVVRPLLDYACHIDTGIGIAETHEFVRSTCAAWGLPLIEQRTTEDYDDIVLKHGFPGPFGHVLMYRRLKERPLREVRRRFVRKRGERVIFVSGVRRHESARRFRGGYSPVERDGSVVWVMPIFEWTDEIMLAYRREHPDLPRSPVADHLHMSGDCLCGAFAHPGELDEIALWYPEMAKRIRDLEHRAEEAGVPCRWGTRPPAKPLDGQEALPVFGPLCSSCARWIKGDEVLIGVAADSAAAERGWTG